MTAPDLAAIAAKLTPAQRRTVLAGELVYGPGYWPLRHALMDKGLVTVANQHAVLSQLGRQLRTYLRELA